MIQKNLRIRILFGYIILMAVIGSMAAILIHERQRMQEVGTEATRVRKKRLSQNETAFFVSAKKSGKS